MNMALSADAVKRLMIAEASQAAGIEIANAIDTNTAAIAAFLAVNPFSEPAVITATSTSTTVDFAKLAVGDIVVHIPSTPGNCGFTVCAVAGTLAVAAVVGDLYFVARAYVPPKATVRTDNF